MSTAQNTGDAFDSLWIDLEEARKEIPGLTQHDLWLQYHSKGGTIAWDSFRNYLRGHREPRVGVVGEYNRAAKIVNKELSRLGRRTLPYVELVPPPKGRKTKPATTNKTANSKSYSQQTSLAA